MNPTIAQELIDAAIEFQLARLAEAIAAAPDNAISPQMPEIQQLREILSTKGGGDRGE